MRKVIIIVLLVLLGGAAGLGLAFLAGKRLFSAANQPVVINDRALPQDGIPFGYRGGRGEYRQGMGGMMQPYLNGNQTPNGTRITLDQAVEKVTAAVNQLGSDLQVTEVMEFQDNFYAAVTEKSSGRGAFELLVDPYSGAVSYEPGPNMMWNLKYGHMGSGLTLSQDNALTVSDASALAQKALDAQGNGATVESTGIDFYGYYTFDYQVDGKIAGMMSVNGADGQVWFHTWHGAFISEKEIAQ